MKDYIETQYKNLDLLDEAREKAVPTDPENVETSTLMDGYVWWTCRACGNLQHTDQAGTVLCGLRTEGEVS